MGCANFKYRKCGSSCNCELLIVWRGAAIFGTIKTDNGIVSPVLVTNLILATPKLREDLVSAPNDEKQTFSCHEGFNCSASANVCEIKER